MYFTKENSASYQREQCIIRNEERLLRVNFTILYTKRYVFLPLRTQYRRAVYLLSWQLRVTSIWKLESTLVHRVTWRSLWEIGHELSLSFVTWRISTRNRIFTRNEYKDNFISVGPLNLHAERCYARMYRFFVRMTLTEAILRHMLEFDGYIDITFERLVRLVEYIQSMLSICDSPTSRPKMLYTIATFSMDINSSIANY